MRLVQTCGIKNSQEIFKEMLDKSRDWVYNALVR